MADFQKQVGYTRRPALFPYFLYFPPKDALGLCQRVADENSYMSVLRHLSVPMSSLSLAARLGLNVLFPAANLRPESTGFGCGKYKQKRMVGERK